MSGFLRMIPRPEQGTSAMTTSAARSQAAWCSRASASMVRMHPIPRRWAPLSISFSLCGWMSQAMISPSPSIEIAAAKDFPPGAAHTSCTRSPFLASATTDTRCAAASCTIKRPSEKAGNRSRLPVPLTVKQCSSHGWRSTAIPACFSSSTRVSSSVLSRFVCMVVGTISLFPRRNCSASSGGKISSSLFTSHSGWLYRMDKYSAVPLQRISGIFIQFVTNFRSTALTMPAALGRPFRRHISTASLTAARWGILSMNRI